VSYPDLATVAQSNLSVQSLRQMPQQEGPVLLGVAGAALRPLQVGRRALHLRARPATEAPQRGTGRTHA
jgi:hypothetical protein